MLRLDDWDDVLDNQDRSELVIWKWDGNIKTLQHWYTKALSVHATAAVAHDSGIIYHSIEQAQVHSFHVSNPSELIADATWTGPSHLGGRLGCASAVVGKFLLIGVENEGIYILDGSNNLEQVHFLELSFVSVPNLVASPEGMIATDGKFQGRKGLHFFSLSPQGDGSLHYELS